MKKNTLILLGIVAVLLIAAAVICIVIFLQQSDIQPEDLPPETEASTETQHGNTEYRYNEDGQISKILYYENDVLQGSTDYVYTDDYTCIIHFDKDNEQTGYEQTDYNALKNPVKYIKKEAGELVTSTEYDYFEDLSTLRKKITKTYKDGIEYAEKEYYDEAGKMTRKCTYEDDSLTGDITYTYDANGEAVDSAPTSTNDGGDTDAA